MSHKLEVGERCFNHCTRAGGIGNVSQTEHSLEVASPIILILLTPLYGSSDFHWPAKLRGDRPRNLEQSTSLATSPRTVTEHLQAPAEDLAFPARVNHRPAPL